MQIKKLEGVLCAGNIVFDILVHPVEAMAWNTTTWVESIEQHMGGNGANTSFALAKLGAPVRLISVTGQDAFGCQLLDKLCGAGIDVSAVTRSESPTAATVALVRPNGDRLFLHRAGASAEGFGEPIEFTPALIAGISHFHLGNAFAFPRLRRHSEEVMRRAHAAGLTTSIDTGWDSQGRWLLDLGGSLPHTDLLFVNEDEACRFGGVEPFDAAARRLQELGAGAVVVKRGAAGASVFSGESRTDVPAFAVDAVDTTGAGDCFAGAFLAGLHRGLDYAGAARFANAAAALTVQQLGATTGLRSWDETRAWIAGQAD